MPRATSNIQETQRFDLKTLPSEGDEECGFIVVRRLTYGEKLQRRAMTASMQVSAKKGQKDFAGEMQLVNEQATLFDFQKCIVDHNLEDENGTKLNLGSMQDVRKLDPRIGEEIDTLISDLNNFEDDDDEGN